MQQALGAAAGDMRWTLTTQPNIRGCAERSLQGEAERLLSDRYPWLLPAWHSTPHWIVRTNMLKCGLQQIRTIFAALMRAPWEPS